MKDVVLISEAPNHYTVYIVLCKYVNILDNNEGEPPSNCTIAQDECGASLNYRSALSKTNNKNQHKQQNVF